MEFVQIVVVSDLNVFVSSFLCMPLAQLFFIFLTTFVYLTLSKLCPIAVLVMRLVASVMGSGDRTRIKLMSVCYRYTWPHYTSVYSPLNLRPILVSPRQGTTVKSAIYAHF